MIRRGLDDERRWDDIESALGSAGVQRAIRMLAHPTLEDDYAQAWEEWSATGQEQAWENAAADGLDRAPR